MYLSKRLKEGDRLNMDGSITRMMKETVLAVDWNLSVPEVKKDRVYIFINLITYIICQTS